MQRTLPGFWSIYPLFFPFSLLFLSLASSPHLLPSGDALPSCSPQAAHPCSLSLSPWRLPRSVWMHRFCICMQPGWSHAPLFQPTWSGGTAPWATVSRASLPPLESTTARAPARSHSTSWRSPGWCWHQKRRKLWNEPTSKSHTHHQKPLRNWLRSSTWKPAPWSTGSTITGRRSPRSPAHKGFILFALAGRCFPSARCVCFC